MKTPINTRHFLLALLLLSFGVLLATQYFSNPLIKAYTNIAFGISTLAIAVVAYIFTKEINHAARLYTELHIREVQLRETLNSLEEGVITTDKQGRIQRMNPSAEMLTGWKSTEAANLPLEKVYDVVNEETGMHFQNIVKRILTEGKTIEFENNTILRKKTGGELIISNSGSPVLDVAENVVGSVLVFRDITQKKKLEEEQSLFSSIISSSNDAVISKNFDGIIQTWNNAAEKIFGYTAEEAIGKSVLMLIPPDRAHEETEIITQMKKGVPIRHFETERLKKDGTRLQVSLSISPVIGPKGNIIGISKIARDITERKQAEEKLKASEKQFRAMIEKSADMISLARPDGTFIYGSPSITKALGYELEEFFQLSAFDLIHAEDVSVLGQKVEDILQTPGKSFYNQHRLKHKNGHWLWTEGIMTNMLHEPAIGALISNFRDITEQRNAEDKLKANFAALTVASKMQTSILDALPANIALLDKDGVIVEVNEAWVRFGEENNLHSADYSIGDNYIEISDHATGEDEEAGKQIAEGIRAVIKGTAKLFELEYPCHSPTEQRWFKAEVAPLMKEHGTGVVVMHINITERKKAEEKLLQSEASLNAVFENTDATVYSLDPQYRYIKFNSALSNSLKDAYGLEVKTGDMVFGFLEKLNPAEASEWKSIYDRALAGEVVKFVKHFAIHNTERYVSFSINPISESGIITGLSCFALDITKEKLAEAEVKLLNESLEQKVKERTAELTQANSALEAFSYSVSHDLRSPVRSVVGFSKIIAKEYGNTLNADVKEMFEHIANGGKRMNAIIDDLLLLAKFGKEKLRIAEVDMTKLFKEVWNTHLFDTSHGATLQMQNLPKVPADRSMLKQVIVNLISNAVKYSSKKDKPVIKIGFEEKDDKIIFHVSDNGAGFDMKNYNKLFGAFQRLHGSSEFEGTGIGLTLIKSIIDRHGGEVWGEGKVDEGATFYFSLPRKNETIK